MKDNDLIQLKKHHLDRRIGGVCAICSVHPMVLKAAVATARELNQWLLVEVTPNQVNLSGGYSGMTPNAFSAHMRQLIQGTNRSPRRVYIGADHLGPHLWRDRPAAVAMRHCEELVSACVRAGFEKIHLDTAVSCADDKEPLDPELVAGRAAMLCGVAEASARHRPLSEKPVYVIGDEVPPPGGGLGADGKVTVTDTETLGEVLDVYHRCFIEAGLEEAWQRIIAVVVQPGIEFGDRQIAVYRPSRASQLKAFHAKLPAKMTYEVHSADYQPARSLENLVRDHFVVFKIGPCLTHVVHQTLLALADLEASWKAIRVKSNLRQEMEQLMRTHPEHWASHYEGNAQEQKHLREHSLRDRVRYYWTFPKALKAVDQLLQNLDRPLPLDLLQHFLPEAFHGADTNSSGFSGRSLVDLRLRQTLLPCFKAFQSVPRS
jgi:D-tagatose-1,6-bisphosphate aldolase subunit GatZ/KbaZ